MQPATSATSAAAPAAPPDAPARAGVSPWTALAPILVFLAVLGAASLVVLRMSFGVPGDEWRTFTLQNYADLADAYFLS